MAYELQKWGRSKPNGGYLYLICSNNRILRIKKGNTAKLDILKKLRKKTTYRALREAAKDTVKLSTFRIHLQQLIDSGLVKANEAGLFPMTKIWRTKVTYKSVDEKTVGKLLADDRSKT